MMTSSARPPRAVYLDINIQVTPKQISRTKADGMPIIAAPNRSPLKIIQAGPIVKMAASKPAPAKNWMNASIRVRSSEANIHQRIRRMARRAKQIAAAMKQTTHKLECAAGCFMRPQSPAWWTDIGIET
jgi:hypothetical protein